MKIKIFGILFLMLLIVFGAVAMPEKKENNDYLRLHIRANSNAEVDQNVKYKIKDKVVEMLTPFLCNVSSKENAINVVNEKKVEIINGCENLLKRNGFKYSVNVKINNEYFPARTYCNTTLESGYYDAVIVELGEAKGDNWWCVMYPPLCFVNKNEEVKQIKYKSKVVEWFKSIFY